MHFAYFIRKLLIKNNQYIIACLRNFVTKLLEISYIHLKSRKYSNLKSTLY